MSYYKKTGEEYPKNSVTQKIEHIINSYKLNFTKVHEKERYKWIAVAWYKKHWDIEAKDFGEMVSIAFAKSGNLLSASMYYAYKMLVSYAKAYPEKVRALFRILHDETLPLEQRYQEFRTGFNEYISILKRKEEFKGKSLQHYQDLHAISVYLFFEYPETYYIYKAKIYNSMRDRIGFQEKKMNSILWKIENYTRMSEQILEVLLQDEELLHIKQNSLDENCYQDSHHHLLVMDIAFYGAIYMDEKDFDMENKHIPEEEYCLPLEEIVLEESITDVKPNTILYGPPGTGKTYHTVIYAVAIIENKQLKQIQEETYQEVLTRYNMYKSEGKIAFTTFHQSYGYEEFIEGIKPMIVSDSEKEGKKEVVYDVLPGVFKRFCDRASKSMSREKYVFIIDEINRGNISKIFGELITLIEPSKRLWADEETQVILPYSGEIFGVPNNIYLIGTMNTADRSIATIDTALRRRFYFKEILPQPNVLKDVYVEDISICEMLTRINKRIVALYDREHTIGHAYFMELKVSPTIDILAQIFEYTIIPLLQEYFYDDYEKIRLVLGDNQKEEMETQFIISKANDYSELFGYLDMDLDETYCFEINKEAFANIESYRSI